jgi:Protein of unknown function (DUF3575)
MKKIFTLILIFSLLFSFGQETEKEKKWIVKTNILSLVDAFSFPTIQLGLERTLTKNLSVNVESGIQLYSFNFPKNKTDTLSIKNGGFKFNIEARYYLNNSNKVNYKKNWNSFIAIQAFYRGNNYGSIVNYSIDPNYDKPYNYNQNNNIIVPKLVDEFEVKKSIYGINILVGNQINLIKNVIVEPYFGIGVMDRQVRNFNRSFKNNKVESQNCNHCFFSDFSEDSGIVLNLTYGFRIGYKL